MTTLAATIASIVMLFPGLGSAYGQPFDFPQAEPLPLASDPESQPAEPFPLQDSTTADGTPAQNVSLQPPGNPNAPDPSTAPPTTVAPNDIIVDQTFARTGAMFQQLDGPAQPRTFDFPGSGTRYRLGHQTGRAVGRKESITQLGAMPYVIHGNSMLYAEGQAYRANGGDLLWGGMAGGGVRQYIPSLDRIFGGGVFWSRDDISVVNFSQLVVSAETMGEFFDARVNVHLPLGTRSGIGRTEIIQESARFIDHRLEFDRFRTVVTSMKGVDYEIVVPLPGPMGEDLDLTMAVGGYYFDGPEVEDVLGWKMRLDANVFNTVDLELQVSDDQTFNTTVMFGASFSFGGPSRLREGSTQFNRMTEWGRRISHSIARNTRVIDKALIAKRPDNGEEYFFHHVANNPNFTPILDQDGRVETPFETIAQAQNAIAGVPPPPIPADFIIVHAESSYATNVVLNPGNQVLGQGQGAPHSIEVLGFPEKLLLPEVRLGNRPVLNLAGLNVSGVTMAADTQFSGFQINQPDLHGMVISGIPSGSFAIANYNTIQNAGMDGVRIVGSNGTIALRDTAINYIDAAPTAPLPGVRGLFVSGGAPTVRMLSSDLSRPAGGRIDYQVDDHGAVVDIQNTTGGSIDLRRITIDSTPSPSSVGTRGGLGINITGTAGSVSFGNINVVNAVNGVNISNTTGGVNLTNTFPNASVIDNASGVSLNIDGAQGLVTIDELDIDNRNDIGVNIYDLGGAAGTGQVNFRSNLFLTAPGATAGTQSGINIQNMTGTSSVFFQDPIGISGSNGIGFNIGGVDVVTGGLSTNELGSTITARQLMSIDTTTNSAIRIANDRAAVAFQQVGIASRGAIGVELLGQPDAGVFPLPANISVIHGPVEFNGTLAITNENTVGVPAIDIRNSTAKYSFGIVNITGATGFAAGGAGVNILDNSDGPDPSVITEDFEALFGQLNVTATNGVALFIDNDDYHNNNIAVTNNRPALFPAGFFPLRDAEVALPGSGPYRNSNAVVRTGGGTMTVTGDAAVEANDSGIDITLGQVNVTGGARAVELVDTHFVRLNTLLNRNFNFEISGDGFITGAGGIIQTQTVDGVFAQTTLDGTANQGAANRLDIYEDDQLNTRVKLAGINFAGATVAGVDAVEVQNIQGLHVDLSAFQSWPQYSVDSLNTISLQISRSTMDDPLGAAPANTVQLIRHQADRIPSNGQIYSVTINENILTDRSSDAILIQNQPPLAAPAVGAGGIGASLVLAVENNERIRVMQNGATVDGLDVRWNGPLDARVVGNGPNSNLGFAVGFVMGLNSNTTGDRGDNNRGVNIETFSQTDLATIVVSNNIFEGHANANTGARFQTASPANITVNQNLMLWRSTTNGFTNAGVGFDFIMTSNQIDNVFMNTNVLRDGSQSGNKIGIRFQPSTNAFITLNGNDMDRTFNNQPFLQGIQIQNAGALTLSGVINNPIRSNQAFFVGNPNTVTGTVIINNTPLP